MRALVAALFVTLVAPVVAWATIDASVPPLSRPVVCRPDTQRWTGWIGFDKVYTDGGSYEIPGRTFRLSGRSADGYPFTYWVGTTKKFRLLGILHTVQAFRVTLVGTVGGLHDHPVVWVTEVLFTISDDEEDSDDD